MKIPILDNIVWHAMAGPHLRHSVGTATARRYRPGLPAFVGFADLDRPDFHALTPYVAPEELLYCDGWSGRPPTGWRIESEAAMSRMIWSAATPAADICPASLLLAPRHGPAALELASLTGAGPFGMQAFALGDYLGMFDDGRLVAMAGTRNCADGLTEICGVCTHPAYRGRGFASRLVLGLVRRSLVRGELPFLRVLRDRRASRDLYLRMGFRQHCVTPARTIRRL